MSFHFTKIGQFGSKVDLLVTQKMRKNILKLGNVPRFNFFKNNDQLYFDFKKILVKDIICYGDNK